MSELEKATLKPNVFRATHPKLPKEWLCARTVQHACVQHRSDCPMGKSEQDNHVLWA